MVKLSQVRLSEVAIIFGFVFILSAVGCGGKSETKYKIGEPILRVAGDPVGVGFKTFAENPTQITSAHYLEFDPKDAEQISVSTMCTVTNKDGVVQNFESNKMRRDFVAQLFILEILPHEVSLKAFSSNDTVICSFDFIAHANDGAAHTFRLFNVKVDTNIYPENIYWDQPFSESVKKFGAKTEADVAVTRNGSSKRAVELYCTAGRTQITIAESAIVNESIITTVIDSYITLGEITWENKVQECALARIENGIVKARSKGFILSLAPSIETTFIPRADKTFANGSKAHPDAGISFDGVVGELVVVNTSNDAVTVVVPKVIPMGANVKAIAEANKKSLEAKSYCQYQATVHLVGQSGEVVDLGDSLQIQLSAKREVKLAVIFKHKLKHGGISGGSAKGGAAREVFIQINGKLSPFIQIYDGLNAKAGDELLAVQNWKSVDFVRVHQEGTNPSKNIITENSFHKFGNTSFCKIKEF